MLMEGRISNGILLVSRTAVVGKAARFFYNDRLAYMSDMVQAIINAMTVNSFTANQVSIVYDNGLEVDFHLDENLTSAKRASGMKGIGGIGSLFSKDKGGTNEATKAIAKNSKGGVIRHRKAWGVYITESDAGEMYTTVSIERDLVDYLVSEFQERGYKVISVEPPETSLLYLRKFLPFTYDALHKIIVYAERKDKVTFYTFTKDMPSGTKNVAVDEVDYESFGEAIKEAVTEEIEKSKLRNPNVMLVGRAFKDEEMYLNTCDSMREAGINIVDIYGLWHDKSQPINMIRTAVPTDGMIIELNGQFGICLSALIRSLEPKPENLIEGFHPMFLRDKTKRAIAGLVKTIATAAAIYGLVTCGVSAYEVYVAREESQRAADATSYQLSIAERERNLAREKLNALGTIDSRYNEIFKFVYAHVNNNLNIASIDTIDMIPTAESSDSMYTDASAEGGEGSVEVTATTAQEYVMQTIVVRGYSRTSEGPVELYRALAASGMGEIKIIGIEQVGLPSGETIFAFEMTIGTM